MKCLELNYACFNQLNVGQFLEFYILIKHQCSRDSVYYYYYFFFAKKDERTGFTVCFKR